MIQPLAPLPPCFLTLHRARGQGCAAPPPCGDRLSDKQHAERLRVGCEGNGMWKRGRWKEAEALWLCCASCGWGGCTGQPAVAPLRNAPSFPSRCSCSPARTNPALTLQIDQYSPTPIVSSQGPFARVTIVKFAGWMFCLIIKIYIYNNMIKSQIMSSDFFPLILAFQGVLAGLALYIIPQKSHSSRGGLIHEGPFLPG